MALYREGKAALAADGTVTGTGTKWQSSLSLIRPGATIMFLSSTIQMAVVNKVVSDTEIKAITTNGTVVASTDYAILLSDSLTVDGLAQDVAETLRYYQSQETVIADAVEFFKTFDFESLQNLANQVKADSQSAGTSAAAAAASETAAKNSEINAAALQADAANSASAANTAKTGSEAARDAALDAKTAAELAEANAKISETNAAESKRLAEAAIDVANSSAGIYQDTTSGLAVTATGGYFSVPSPMDDEVLILYRNDAGIATEVKRYPSAVGVENTRASMIGMAASLVLTQSIIAEHHAFI